jgi:glycosyltransferase involved in cell wall biosynthesis
MSAESRFLLTNARWQSAAAISREFVRHANPQPSTGTLWTIAAPAAGEALISVVIPTSDAERRGLFQKLLNQLAEQTLQNFEVLVIKGDPRQGRAINVGVACSRGRYLITLDDDTDLMSPEAFERLVAVMESNADIGIAGGNAVIPPGASRFVRRTMVELPRRAWMPVEEITESDLVQHPLLIMRVADFKTVGGENELIPRGLDPYLRREIRGRNMRIVLVPAVVYAHLPPDRLGVLLKQFFRNGFQAAYVNRHFPQWVIETPSHHGVFREQVPLPLRVFRLPARLIGVLLHGQLIRFLCESAYLLGFTRQWLFNRR